MNYAVGLYILRLWSALWWEGSCGCLVIDEEVEWLAVGSVGFRT